MKTPAGCEPGVVMPAKPATDAVCFVWRDDRILARATEPPTLPTLAARLVELGRPYVVQKAQEHTRSLDSAWARASHDARVVEARRIFSETMTCLVAADGEARRP